MIKTQTMKASYKKLWCIRAKVLVLVVFCLAQISINAKLYVSKNALVVNEISTNSNNDSLVSKNLNEIYASKNAIIIADNKKYNCAPKQLYAETTENTKKAIISKKISVKKTIAHYAATSYRAHVISKTSENLFYNASLVIESGAIINLQTKVLQNFIVEFIKSIVHSYNMLYVVEIMPIINFIDLEISKYCKKKEDKDTV